MESPTDKEIIQGVMYTSSDDDHDPNDNLFVLIKYLIPTSL